MSIKVLVVEDDPVFRDAFVQAIAAANGMALMGEAATLAQGLALLALQPDVLLVDLRLPDGNGIDLIRAATQSSPGCEIMVVTVFGDEASVLDSIAAGATGYLLKDLNAAEIVEIRVLGFAGKGFSYDEIAALMQVSRHSVQTYVKRAYRKLQVHTKVEALAEARRLQLLRG